MSIQYQYFPKSSRIPDLLSQLILVFQQKDECISSIFQLDSNDVLQCLSDKIIQLGYKVEISKRANDKIRIPVLFGRNGALEKILKLIATTQYRKLLLRLKQDELSLIINFLKIYFKHV